MGKPSKALAPAVPRLRIHVRTYVRSGPTCLPPSSYVEPQFTSHLSSPFKPCEDPPPRECRQQEVMGSNLFRNVPPLPFDCTNNSSRVLTRMSLEEPQGSARVQRHANDARRSRSVLLHTNVGGASRVFSPTRRTCSRVRAV